MLPPPPPPPRKVHRLAEVQNFGAYVFKDYVTGVKFLREAGPLPGPHPAPISAHRPLHAITARLSCAAEARAEERAGRSCTSRA
jgi:hypothetical protein